MLKIIYVYLKIFFNNEEDMKIVVDAINSYIKKNSNNNISMDLINDKIDNLENKLLNLSNKIVMKCLKLILSNFVLKI